jgi:serine/threonine protein kinase
VIATFQDEKWVNIVFKDHFVCDLSLAIQDKAIQDDWKPYYLACIYSAICKVHSLGLIHRLINSSSLFITKGGTVKLADFRFARRMEGNYCFTICGDPNYFAPEIVTQQGYDYSIDLWAFGCLIYELFENTTPFGTSETDETTIFRALSGYRNGKINFTSKTTSDAKSLILDILQYDAESRAGYKKEETIKDADFFTGISWDQLESHRGHPIDLSPQVEIQALFDDPLVTPTLHAAFDSF